MQFFAKLKPYSEIAYTQEHRRLALIDFDTDDDLLEQEQDFLAFYREHAGKWALFHQPDNGHIYAAEANGVVLVSEEWFTDRIPGTDTVTFLKGLRGQLIDLRLFADGHHSQQEGHEILHGLTVDVPCRLNQIVEQIDQQFPKAAE